MQALCFDQKGDLGHLALIEHKPPQPGEGEVLVAVRAAGLNPSDVKNVLGFFPYTTLPRIPGRDFAGVVQEGPAELLGKKVWGTGMGLGFKQDGSHAQFIALPAKGVALMPESLSFAQAASCGVPYTTAWDGLARTDVGPDTRLLVIGANGAVGRAAIALGRAIGANVLAAVRRPEQAEALAAEGFAPLLLANPEELGAQAQNIWEAPPEVIFDTTAAWLAPAVRAAGPHGRLCVIAPPGMGKLTVDFPVLDFYRRGLTLIGVNSLLHDTVSCAAMLESFAKMFDATRFDAKILPPPAEPRQMPLSEGLQAYRLVNEGFSEKIVLVND